MAPPELVLVLNVGSSSVKAALVAAGAEAGHQGGLKGEPTGGDPSARPWTGERELRGEPLAQVLEQWLLPQLQPWWPHIQLAGHRVVHGGEALTRPTAIDAAVLAQLRALVPLAPLHNGPALEAILWLQAARPSLPQWACFDTGFHASLAPEAYTYAIPEAWRRRGLRRFGFHGLNHQHVAETVARRQASGQGPDQRPAGELRLISCHLGAGCSLAAIRGGRSLDTTMGFTPLEGLVMASRSGSVDPGLLLHLLREGLPLAELDQQLTRESGLQGLSALSGDWRELRQAAGSGHGGAQLALAVFRHSLLKGIGAMAASLGGVDVIALSGGIGANDALLAEELRAALVWLPPFTLLAVPADEEGMVARLCLTASSQPWRFQAQSAPAQGFSPGGRADPASGAAAGSGAGDRR